MCASLLAGEGTPVTGSCQRACAHCFASPMDRGTDWSTTWLPRLLTYSLQGKVLPRCLWVHVRVGEMSTSRSDTDMVPLRGRVAGQPWGGRRQGGWGTDPRHSADVSAVGVCPARLLCSKSGNLRWASPLGTKIGVCCGWATSCT